MSELRTRRPAASRSPSRAVAQRPSRVALRAVACVLPWLVLGAACLDEEDAPEDELSMAGSQGLGQSPTATAGAGGATAMGSGGTEGTQPTTLAGGSGGGLSSMGGSGQTAVGGSSGNIPPGELPAAPGETGIFVGMTAAHNAARQALMANPPLPDLTWSEELAEFSQEWADELASSENCGTIFHRDQRMYGENIAFQASSRANVVYYPEEAVESWVSEVDCWDYGTILGNRAPTANSEQCDAMCIARLNSSGCGHYTQIVWRNSREVGCGYSTCQYQGLTAHVWVCNYDPPGNFVGQVPY